MWWTGYHEGSGAATAFDLWLALAPLVEQHNSRPDAPAYIVPFMIQIDNGYGEPAGPGAVPAPPQLFVPALAYGGSWGANQERARQAAQSEFLRTFEIEVDQSGGTKRYCGPRYVHFAVRAHPGPAAPLGWTLSDISFDDLVDQFNTLAAGQDPLTKVQKWLKPTLESVCPPPTPG